MTSRLQVSEHGGQVLLPSGEGGQKGRMRAGMPKDFRILNPHPPLRATLSRRERDTTPINH